MSPSKIALLTIIGASFFFSLSPIVTKILYHSFEPMPLAFLRFLIASIFILPIFFYQKKESLFKSFRAVAPYSIFSTLNILLFYLGIARTTADSSAIIYCDVPIVTAILSYFLIKERLDRRKKFGILLGLLGVTLIAILPLFQKSIKTGDLTGNILILIATFMWAIYVIMSKKIIGKGFSPITVSAISFIVSAVIFFAISLFVAKKDFIAPIFTASNFLLLLLLGGVVTVGSYVLMQWAIKHTSATTVSLNQYISPIFTISLAAAVLGEKITAEFVIGAILVFAGVFMATYMSDRYSKQSKDLASLGVSGE